VSEENFSLVDRIKSVPVHFEDKMYQYILSQNRRPPTDSNGNKESNGDGDRDDGGGRRRGQWRRQQEQCQWQQGWLGSNSNKGDCDEGGGRTTVTRVVAMVTAIMWVMPMVTMLVGDKEGKGEGGKGKCNGNEGGGRRRG
jgi:hypothetical protein